MPTYDYLCKKCKKEFSVFLTIKEFEAKPQISCSYCKSKNVQKMITNFLTKTSKKS